MPRHALPEERVEDHRHALFTLEEPLPGGVHATHVALAGDGVRPLQTKW